MDRGNGQEHVALQAAFREITEVSLVEETSRGLAKSASALGLPPDPSLTGASLSPERSRFAGAGQASAAQLDLPTSFIPPLQSLHDTLQRLAANAPDQSKSDSDHLHEHAVVYVAGREYIS